MILSFLKIKNDVLQSNTSLFVEKVQKNFSEKIPQNHFYCIFKKEFFKKFQIFEIFRKPRAFGARNTTFGGLRPPKVGGPSPSLAEKNLGDDIQKSPNLSRAQWCSACIFLQCHHLLL